jgi:hypothetical protein
MRKKFSHGTWLKNKKEAQKNYKGFDKEKRSYELSMRKNEF